MNTINLELIYEKGKGFLNEDYYVASNNIYGVFDGATSLNGCLYDSKLTGGWIASRTAAEIFEKNNDSLKNLALEANRQIKNKMMKQGVNVKEKSFLWSSAAAVVKVAENRVSWVQAGDSVIILIYKDGCWKIPFKGRNHDYQTLKMWKDCVPEADQQIQDVLMDQIIAVREKMNIEYGVLNGEDSFQNFLEWGREDITGLKNILIFTDGLFIPQENPTRGFDFSDFMDIYFKTGLKGVKSYVRDLEAKDPFCRKYPRFKTHDDIAAMDLSFN